MDISITAKGLQLTDRFRDYATEKAEKIAALADRAIALEIKASRRGESRGASPDDRVELTLIGPGPLVRAESTGADKYAAFDLAYAKLLERVRQAKDRRKVHRGGRRRPTSLQEASAGGFAVVDITPASVEALNAVATGGVPVVAVDEIAESPVVIRRKLFPSTTMTAEEAVDHMELVGHDFFLYVDATTDRPSVVYRRKGWNYGVISLESEQEDALAGGGRRR